MSGQPVGTLGWWQNADNLPGLGEPKVVTAEELDEAGDNERWGEPITLGEYEKMNEVNEVRAGALRETAALNLREQVLNALRHKGFVSAVKLHRELAGTGLIEAKRYVDELVREEDEAQKRYGPRQQTVDEMADTEKLVLAAYRKRGIVAAVKMYREITGAGLAEAKKYVDWLRDRFVMRGDDTDSLPPPPKASSPVHPPHYRVGGIECIDAMKQVLGADGFHAYCHGNALKYVWRSRYKGKREEDLRKAIFYLRCAVGEDPRRDA